MIDHDALRASCRRLHDGGLAFTKQAKEAGVPYGTFTNWLGGTYAGDNDRVAAEVAKWLDSRQTRAACAAVLPAAPAYVATPTAAAITDLLSFAQVAPDIVVVAAGAGVGKTTTARQYKATRPNVHLATMRPTTAGTHTMLAEIAEVMGLDARSATRTSRAIGAKVQGTGALLIVDEAQHLQTAALDELRSLHDGWGVGIALVGNESVYSRLEGQARQSSLSQLFSRVGMRLTQGRPRPDDVRHLVAAWGIDDPGMVKTLASISGKPGALRAVTKTLRLAAMLAAGAEQPLADTHLLAAWRQLGNITLE